MNHYSFSDRAIRDLNRICDDIAQSNPKRASQLFDEVRKKCKLVAEFPQMGKNYSNLKQNLSG
ncbi:MAG: type II toxin-antitoxin system RelE/ParE family toxin [Spirulinaceae cyanobacterium]